MSKTNELQVLLVDDHSLVRAGFRGLIERLPNIQIVGEARDGQEALDLIEKHKPNIVLMDIGLPGLNGLEVLSRARKLSAQTRVIMLSIYSDEETVRLALQLGAAGYLLKDASISELELAMSSVAEGNPYLSPAVLKYVLADYIRCVNGEQSARQGRTQRMALTPRQREVLQLVAEGYTSQQIAEKLCLSTKTVEAHRTQIMERLNIHDYAGLIRFAVKARLVTPDKLDYGRP